MRILGVYLIPQPKNVRDLQVLSFRRSPRQSPRPYPLHFSQLSQLLLLHLPEHLQRIPQLRPLEDQRDVVKRTLPLEPEPVAEFLDIPFQFRNDEVPLSDYVGFDAQGTARAEGRRVRCRYVEEGDGAVAPFVEGRAGVAGLGRREIAAVAAGGVS